MHLLRAEILEMNLGEAFAEEQMVRRTVYEVIEGLERQGTEVLRVHNGGSDRPQV